MIEALVTAAEAPVISLDRVRSHLRIVDDEEDDATLEFYLAAAVQRVENLTRRALKRQTWAFHFACFMTPLVLGRG
ncbi:MAG: head-tail connector protein, partial [Pseudomonadota bacterium]